MQYKAISADGHVNERAGATPSEIERIMWKNAADLYKLPYEEPVIISAAA